MLNTLAIVKKMTAAGMPVQQAEAVAETLVTSLEDEVASKRDVDDARKELKKDIDDVRKDLKKDIDDVRRDMKAMESDLRRDIKDVEVKLLQKMSDQVLQLEKLLERMQFKMLRVGIGLALGVVAMLTFLSRFLGK